MRCGLSVSISELRDKAVLRLRISLILQTTKATRTLSQHHTSRTEQPQAEFIRVCWTRANVAWEKEAFENVHISMWPVTRCIVTLFKSEASAEEQSTHTRAPTQPSYSHSYVRWWKTLRLWISWQQCDQWKLTDVSACSEKLKPDKPAAVTDVHVTHYRNLWTAVSC